MTKTLLSSAAAVGLVFALSVSALAQGPHNCHSEIFGGFIQFNNDNPGAHQNEITDFWVDALDSVKNRGAWKSVVARNIEPAAPGNPDTGPGRGENQQAILGDCGVGSEPD